MSRLDGLSRMRHGVSLGVAPEVRQVLAAIQLDLFPSGNKKDDAAEDNANRLAFTELKG